MLSVNEHNDPITNTIGGMILAAKLGQKEVVESLLGSVLISSVAIIKDVASRYALQLISSSTWIFGYSKAT